MKRFMKTKTFQTYVFVLIFALLFLLLNWNMIRVNMVVFLTLKRGIISQNCFWWKVNDLFQDTTGAQIYRVLEAEGRFVKLNIIGEKIYLLTDIRDITELLELSPNPFGPGILKKNFFESFMPRNVGISTDPEWKYRRDFNDKVLQTDKYHNMNSVFNGYIKEVLETHRPHNFDEFTEMARVLTSKILFGTDRYNDIVYKVFKQADSLLSARFGIHMVNKEDENTYRAYLREQLEHPKPNTLLSIAHSYHHSLPMEDVIDQIPHWIFPIAGLFSVHLPRLLVLLANHQESWNQVVQEMKQGNLLHSKESYTRKCILELFRLNNAVNSTFRGLTQPHQFEDSEHVFDADTQFVFFNNPVLRDLFEQPNEFVPLRWNKELEESHRALMFNQGNQRCPGKELVISLLTMGLVHYVEMKRFSIRTNIQIDPTFVPYIINPCTITFEK